MKYLLISMLCLMLTGCAGMFKENNLSVYGNPQGDGAFGIRAGTDIMENLELGASANYKEGQDEINKVRRKRWYKPRKVVRVQDEIEDWSYGLHLIRHFPNVIDGVSPYIGGQATIGEGTFDIGNTIQPIGGANFRVNDTVSVFTEYQQETTADEQRKFLFGVRLAF